MHNPQKANQLRRLPKLTARKRSDTVRHRIVTGQAQRISSNGEFPLDSYDFDYYLFKMLTIYGLNKPYCQYKELDIRNKVYQKQT